MIGFLWSPTVVTRARFVARPAEGVNGFVLSLAMVAVGAVGGVLVLRRRREASNMTANTSPGSVQVWGIKRIRLAAHLFVQSIPFAVIFASKENP